jgi:uncharacterized membrane protein YhaH (DUF805 family)
MFFNSPFSFEGRIKRLEYGLSLLAGLVGMYVSFVIMRRAGRIGALTGLSLLGGVMWFLLAQGAKRCHDLGKTGWWQCVPLFVVTMLAEPGEPGRNDYDVRPEPSDIYTKELPPPAERQAEDADGPTAP